MKEGTFIRIGERGMTQFHNENKTLKNSVEAFDSAIILSMCKHVI